MRQPSVWNAVIDFLDWLVPRFIDDKVALEETSDGYEIVCSLSDVEPGEQFDGICTMRIFNLFGVALFPKQISDVVPFVNPHDQDEVQ